ncbi:hypothetical protein EH244_28930 [Variovorax beijingensis]|uniref:Uncharacterized protein n=1 Tax=Variovorax beijingensis TaxID=2496117 RepID=A0A3P3E8M6_9BURK|nr:hypothetical protein [Variovorax beijingensis]RRH81448.1 hypothetical protein EH244_28930 [Variovorax beijingensis]
MHNDFTFPLALCKAQWSVGLHTLAMLETCGAEGLSLGAHMLQDRSAQRLADSDAVSRAGDWQALAIAAANAFWRTPGAPDHPETAIAAEHRAAGTAPSRNAVVQDALRTLSAALNARPVRHPRKGRAGPSRAKA